MSGPAGPSGLPIHVARFAELTPLQLYEILRLRVEVFTVEQDCAYQDLDGRDVEPGTLLLWQESGGQVAATIRLLNAGGEVGATRDRATESAGVVDGGTQDATASVNANPNATANANANANANPNATANPNADADAHSGEVIIGRVVTAPQHRGRGLAAELMWKGIALAAGRPIRISAQAHLQRWYETFGFVAFGDGYLEDGIPHIAMRRPGT